MGEGVVRVMIMITGVARVGVEYRSGEARDGGGGGHDPFFL